MRFDKIRDLAPSVPAFEVGHISDSPPAPDGVATPEHRKNGESEKSAISPEERTAAAGLIQSIGSEFSRLRKSGRSGAWADLEDKVAQNGHILVPSGMISAKDWVGMLIDIEQFRKSEGGNMELPGDALATWLSEGMTHVAAVDEKPKKTRKAKVQ